MGLEVPAVTLVALLLGTARAAGFVLLAPPFNSRSIPAPAAPGLRRPRNGTSATGPCGGGEHGSDRERARSGAAAERDQCHRPVMGP